MRKRHYAQVARLRIETAIIEFDLDPEDPNARTLAEQKASPSRLMNMHPSSCQLSMRARSTRYEKNSLQ
jgi:hypothetical protein